MRGWSKQHAATLTVVSLASLHACGGDAGVAPPATLTAVALDTLFAITRTTQEALAAF